MPNAGYSELANWDGRLSESETRKRRGEIQHRSAMTPGGTTSPVAETLPVSQHQRSSVHSNTRMITSRGGSNSTRRPLHYSPAPGPSAPRGSINSLPNRADDGSLPSDASKRTKPTPAPATKTSRIIPTGTKVISLPPTSSSPSPRSMDESSKVSAPSQSSSTFPKHVSSPSSKTSRPAVLRPPRPPSHQKSTEAINQPRPSNLRKDSVTKSMDSSIGEDVDEEDEMNVDYLLFEPTNVDVQLSSASSLRPISASIRSAPGRSPLFRADPPFEAAGRKNTSQARATSAGSSSNADCEEEINDDEISDDKYSPRVDHSRISISSSLSSPLTSPSRFQSSLFTPPPTRLQPRRREDFAYVAVPSFPKGVVRSDYVSISNATSFSAPEKVLQVQSANKQVQSHTSLGEALRAALNHNAHSALAASALRSAHASGSRKRVHGERSSPSRKTKGDDSDIPAKKRIKLQRTEVGDNPQHLSPRKRKKNFSLSLDDLQYSNFQPDNPESSALSLLSSMRHLATDLSVDLDMTHCLPPESRTSSKSLQNNIPLYLINDSPQNKAETFASDNEAIDLEQNMSANRRLSYTDVDRDASHEVDSASKEIVHLTYSDSDSVRNSQLRNIAPPSKTRLSQHPPTPPSKSQVDVDAHTEMERYFSSYQPLDSATPAPYIGQTGIDRASHGASGSPVQDKISFGVSALSPPVDYDGFPSAFEMAVGSGPLSPHLTNDDPLLQQGSFAAGRSLRERSPLLSSVELSKCHSDGFFDPLQETGGVDPTLFQSERGIEPWALEGGADFRDHSSLDEPQEFNGTIDPSLLGGRTMEESRPMSPSPLYEPHIEDDDGGSVSDVASSSRPAENKRSLSPPVPRRQIPRRSVLRRKFTADDVVTDSESDQSIYEASTSKSTSSVKKSNYHRKKSRSSTASVVQAPTRKEPHDANPEAEPELVVGDLTSCHHCRRNTFHDKMKCTAIDSEGDRCGKRFCVICIQKRYPAITFDSYYSTFICPVCTDTCNCSICTRKRGEVYISERKVGYRKAMGLPSASHGGTGNGAASPDTRLNFIPVTRNSPTTTVPQNYWATVYGLTKAERMGVVIDGLAGETKEALARQSTQPPKRRRMFIGSIQPGWELEPDVTVTDLAEDIPTTSKGKGKAGVKDFDLSAVRTYIGAPSVLYEDYKSISHARLPKPRATPVQAVPPHSPSSSLSPLSSPPGDLDWFGNEGSDDGCDNGWLHEGAGAAQPSLNEDIVAKALLAVMDAEIP